MRFPDSVDGLVVALDELFPEVVARPGDTPDDIMHAAIQRGVVQFVKQWRARGSADPPEPRRRGKGRNVSR